MCVNNTLSPDIVIYQLCCVIVTPVDINHLTTLPVDRHLSAVLCHTLHSSHTCRHQSPDDITCRSFFISRKRGVSGRASSRTACRKHTLAPVTASQLHDTADPTAYDKNTPTVTNSWNAVPSGPRRLAAATSAT